ncbi:MAG: alpha/beta fold hydrolase [Candidatus Binatia bacterium]
MFEFFPNNRAWSFTCLRVLAESYYGGGEFNECYRTISRIKAGDIESWYGEWRVAGERNEKNAQSEEASGHPRTARKAYFRASNYYRVAEFFLPHTDEKKIPAYRKSVDCFKGAAKLSTGIEIVEVPYGDTTMPGYFFHPTEPVANPPVLIFTGGADSTAEEISFLGAKEASDRGIACIIVDGPGRGAMLRLKNVKAIPDFEKPVAAIIDYLARRGDVDLTRIGLLGLSMGGYYMARAAAFEKRVKACVVLFGPYNAYTDIYEYYPPLRPQMWWIVGAGSEEEVKRKLGKFTLAGSVDKIECPLLVVHGEDDFITSPKAAMRIYDEAKCEKELKFYKAGEPGSIHCGYDNHTEVFSFIHDWIYDKIGR